MHKILGLTIVNQPKAQLDIWILQLSALVEEDQREAERDADRVENGHCDSEAEVAVPLASVALRNNRRQNEEDRLCVIA